MTTKNNFFETKEQYLAFRKAWSNAVNDPRAKSTLKEVMGYSYSYAGGRFSATEIPTQVKVPGWLTGAHHILYNIVRGREFDNGFTFVRKQSRLINGHYINDGIYSAYHYLKLKINHAKRILDDRFEMAHNPEERKAQLIKYVEEFLEPFAGTITMEQLASITDEQLPTIIPIESCCHSMSQEVRKRLIAGKEVTDEELRYVQRNKEVRNVG